MSTAQFEYKCRRCGKTIDNLDCNLAFAKQMLTLLAAHGNRPGQQTSNVIYMHTTHSCKDGGIGIADLQGFRVVDTSKEVYMNSINLANKGLKYK